MGRRRLTGFEQRERDLPHWEAPGETYVVRFSIWDWLAVDLTRPDIGPVIVDGLRFFDEQRYWLYDYTVMPDHVHAILKPIDQAGEVERLADILGDIKKWTARRINEALGRRGSLWRDESFDRMLRNEAEYAEWAQYVLENPKQAGLVEDPVQWPWWGKGAGV